MRTRSIVLLFGALTISARCLAATEVPPSLMEGSLDYRFFEIENNLPGFGGMFFDANGELNAYMLNPDTMRHRVETYLREYQAKTEHQPVTAIKMLQGQFSFSQLAHWHARLLPELPFEGFAFFDIDETRNRLVIGVSDPAAMAFVRDNVIPSDIPQEAVIIEKADSIRAHKSVGEKFRPIIGGIKITNWIDKGCTAGFNAILDGIRGFVTNSHCTEKVFWGFRATRTTEYCRQCAKVSSVLY